MKSGFETVFEIYNQKATHERLNEVDYNMNNLIGSLTNEHLLPSAAMSKAVEKNGQNQKHNLINRKILIGLGIGSHNNSKNRHHPKHFYFCLRLC